MPAFQTHRTFGLRILRERDFPSRKAFLIGTQGPDPYFFYGQIPWRKRSGGKAVAAFGTELHHIDPASYFLCLLDEVKESDDKSYLSLVYGMMCHYALDRACHPFVFSRTGFAKGNPERKRYNHDHTYLETLIDQLIAGEEGVYTEKAYRFIDLSEGESKRVSSHLYKGISRYLGERKIEGMDGDSFHYALLDYRYVLRLTNVPHYFSKALVSTLMGPGSQVAALNYPRHIKKAHRDIDFLNESHYDWPDPYSGKMRGESFNDLMGKGRKYCLDLFAAADAYLETGDRTLMEKATAGYTHDGIPVGTELTYFESIFDALK